MLRYTLWTPPHGGTARIYINGASGAEKAFLVPAPHGGASVLVAGEAEPGAARSIRAQVIEDLMGKGVPAAQAQSLAWATVLAQTGTPRAPRATAAVVPFPAGAGNRSARVQQALPQHPQSQMTVESIPVEQPILVRVDHREPEQLVAMLRRAQNTTVEVTTLPAGDYEVLSNGKRMLIERKAAADFQNSIKVELRLFDEIHRMSLDQQADHVALIMEGVDPCGGDMLPQSCTGAITCIGLVQSVSVIPTLDANHTAYAIIKCGHHLTGLGYELATHKRKPAALLDQRTYVLQSLPGVSGELAARLLDHFGSVRAVMNATRSQLAKVKGLGDVRIAQILEAIGGD